jgi:hypothetical protein
MKKSTMVLLIALGVIVALMIAFAVFLRIAINQPITAPGV